ncbi:hypothetical protein [Streptomyces microflavus]|uniref:8-oxoguanine DNA glycosylase OGG fold protein n=1 Tax=Streptomyces microflavus TaxID=1919 RepID=UPI002E0D75F6
MIVVQDPVAVADEGADVQGDVARPVHAQHVVVVVIRHTSAALSDARLEDVLRTTRASVRSGDLKSAYARFALNGVGRSFFTKWFAAVDDRGPDADRALILDVRVFRSLNALGWSSREAAGVGHWPTGYAVYVSTMHGLARELGVTAEWLEWLLFDRNGRVHDGDER